MNKIEWIVTKILIFIGNFILLFSAGALWLSAQRPNDIYDNLSVVIFVGQFILLIPTATMIDRINKMFNETKEEGCNEE